MQGHHAEAEQRTMNLRTIPQSEQNNAYQNKLISEKLEPTLMNYYLVIKKYVLSLTIRVNTHKKFQ
jgi:hypothetical protein